jgi:hypothetical protein
LLIIVAVVKCVHVWCSYDPSLIYNFIWRSPFSLVTSIYNFFTSKELGIAHTLMRSVPSSAAHACRQVDRLVLLTPHA